MEEAEFMIVVEPKAFDAADREFERWLSEHQLDRARLADADVRIDLIRMSDGTSKKRYLIRRTAVAELDAHPSFYLGSREHRGEWQRPRAAYVRRRATDRHGTQHLWIRIDPPVVTNPADREISEIVIGPHFESDVLWPEPRFPTPVYVYVPKMTGGSATVFDPADFDLVAWAEIYATQGDAGEGSVSA